MSAQAQKFEIFEKKLSLGVRSPYHNAWAESRVEHSSDWQPARSAAWPPHATAGGGGGRKPVPVITTVGNTVVTNKKVR